MNKKEKNKKKTDPFEVLAPNVLDLKEKKTKRNKRKKKNDEIMLTTLNNLFSMKIIHFLLFSEL